MNRVIFYTLLCTLNLFHLNLTQAQDSQEQLGKQKSTTSVNSRSTRRDAYYKKRAEQLNQLSESANKDRPKVEYGKWDPTLTPNSEKNFKRKPRDPNAPKPKMPVDVMVKTDANGKASDQPGDKPEEHAKTVRDTKSKLPNPVTESKPIEVKSGEAEQGIEFDGKED